MTISILLADDHAMFRDGIRTMLEQQAQMHVVGEAADGREAVKMARSLSPKAVIMDVTMPCLNGVDATHRIRAENSDIKVIALSMHAHRRLVHEMLEAGASGYLLKECAFQELIQAVHAVCERNQVYLSPEVAQVVVHDYLRTARDGATPNADPLTPKEREILQLVAEGCTNDNIAHILHMSGRTVEKHRAKIMEKLEIHRTAELVKYAIREGLTTP